METNTIQRQYDDVIAQHYDLDSQQVTSSALDRAIGDLDFVDLLAGGQPPLPVLDLGMGTGIFLEKLIGHGSREILPYGLDLSENMADIAKRKIPALQSVVDDAANFDEHFPGTSFGLICTHFITGFVPVEHLAPLIFDRLAPGGYWSFIGSSKLAYPRLRHHANNKVLQLAFGGRNINTDDLLCPTDENYLRTHLIESGFEIASSDTIEPPLEFPDFDEFMDFAYTGGWLTPFVEDLGLQNLSRPVKAMLNKFVFPMSDHHHVLLALARKPLT